MCAGSHPAREVAVVSVVLQEVQRADHLRREGPQLVLAVCVDKTINK